MFCKRRFILQTAAWGLKARPPACQSRHLSIRPRCRLSLNRGNKTPQHSSHADNALIQGQQQHQEGGGGAAASAAQRGGGGGMWSWSRRRKTMRRMRRSRMFLSARYLLEPTGTGTEENLSTRWTIVKESHARTDETFTYSAPAVPSKMPRSLATAFNRCR